MDTKIPIKRLAASVAEKSGATQEEAQDFVKALFGCVTAALRTGEAVEIDSIGSFTLTDTPDEPVSFKPCDELANTVNAPFAAFREVDLDPDFPEDFEMVANSATETFEETEVIDNVNESDETAPIVEQTIEPEQEPVIIPEQEPESEPETQSEIPTEVMPEPQPEPESTVYEAKEEDPFIIPEDQEEFVEDSRMNDNREQGSRFGIGFVAGLLTGLIVAGIAMFILELCLK